MSAAAWGSIAVSVVSISLALVFGFARSNAAKEKGRLKARVDFLETRLEWYERRMRANARPPLSGPESVAALRGLSDDPDAA